MKKVILFILASCQMLTVSADFVTEQQARENAATFLANHSNGIQAKAKGVIATPTITAESLVLVSQDSNASRAKTATAVTTSQPCYYIFNKPDSTGFVIVSAESTTIQILAYSNEGYFHVEDIDKGAEVFLNQYEKDVQTARTQGLTEEQQAYIEKLNAASATSTTVKELETAKFNQNDGNWNSYSPYSSGNKYAPCGCVATAAAIIMKYHGWPAQGKGSNSYVSSTHSLSLSRDFSKDTYNWSIIPTSKYSTTDKNWTNDAKEEIAKILLACGIACNMDYDIDGSSAYANDMRAEMVRNFSYASNYVEYSATRNTDGTYTWTDEAWTTASTATKNSLDNNMPVMVSGLSSNGGGHCFIIDGYDSDGLFRYNMGWGGSNNAYYSYNAITTDYNFYLYEIATNIHPQEEVKVLASGTMANNANAKYKVTDDGVMKISGSGTLYWYDVDDVYNNYNITNIIIEEGITGIGNYAFYNNTNLISLTIPSSVTSIGEEICKYCWYLKSIVSKTATPLTLNSNSFSSMTSLQNVTAYVPVGAISSYRDADTWKGMKLVGIGDLDGDGVASLGDVTDLKNRITQNNGYSVAADVDNDGKITVADITQMIKKLNNK